MDNITCNKCSETKPVDDFAIDKQHKSGRKRSCKECVRAYHRDRRAKDPEGVRAKARAASALYASSERGKYMLLKRKASKYGLTPEEYIEVMSRNNGLCEICNKRPAYHLDHCHTSSKVRGALCQQCNTGIGLLSDDIDILKAAIQYLS